MSSSSFSKNAASSGRHSGKLQCLQAFRGLAALAVAFYHASIGIFPLDKYWGIDPARHAFDFGHAGVYFFFVLSGFIISYVHWSQIGLREELSQYIRQRIIRIYPIYWFVLALVVPLYLLYPSFGLPYHRSASTIVSSALLIHVNGSYETELAVAWTLYHEVLFYTVFALLFLSVRAGLAVLLLWMIFSALSLYTGPQSFWQSFIFSPLHLLFLMGMLTCYLLQTRTIRLPRFLLVGGALLFVSAGLDEDYIGYLKENGRMFIYGGASALMLLGAVELERLGRLRVNFLLCLLGDASYSIYLINFTILSLLAKLFTVTHLHHLLPVSISYILLVGLSIAIGIVLHLTCERPLVQGLRRCISPKLARSGASARSSLQRAEDVAYSRPGQATLDAPAAAGTVLGKLIMRQLRPLRR